MKKLLLLTIFSAACMSQLYAQNALGKFSGKILDENGESVPGATIMVKNESTGFETGTVSDVKGNFEIEDLPLGGPYNIKVTYVGYGDKLIKGYRLDMRDHIVVPDIRLSSATQQLDEIVISGFTYKSARDRIGAATRIGSETMEKLPTSSRNYQDLAQLSPLTRGTNITGARGNMRGLTLDGVSNRMHMFGTTAEGAFPVSMEAIREFEIVTNTYSVADGRGGAGTIKAITKSGTNDFQGSAWGYYTGGDLAGVEANKDGDEWKKGERGEYTTSQYGFNISGPIIRDKFHFFVGYDRHVQDQPWRAWNFDNSGATLQDAENNLGITRENLDRVVEHLETNFGVPDVQQYGTINVKRTTENAFARFDWTLDRTHTLMARYNYHIYNQPDKKPGGGLFSTQYKGVQKDHSVLLNLKSRFNNNVRNDLKFSYMNFIRTGNNVYPRVPVGIVRVNSSLPNGQERESSVVFGNQYWAPETISSNDFQLINNLSIMKGNLSWLFGADIQYNRIHDLLTHYQQGEFIYYSLENFLNNQPDEFNRKVPMTEDAGNFVNPKIFTAGLYGEGTWRPADNLELSLGLRWDATYLPTSPKPDPLLESELGIKSDAAPLDLDNIQPRFYLTWDVAGRDRDIVKFGFGSFASEFTSQALSFAMINNAGNFKSVSARKADGNMPEADWPAYYESFDNVPGLGNWLEPNNIDVSGIPNSIHVIDENLKVPMTFKTHVSYSRFLNERFVLTGGLYYSRTKNNYMMENKNLREEPEFFVAAEGNRGVYVEPSLIGGNGLADYNHARKSDLFNEVMMFTNAGWANTSWNAVVEAAYKIRDGELRASYTYGESRGGVRYNSGNPKDKFYTTTSYNSYKELASGWYDDDDMRHKAILTFLSPSFKGFTFNANMTFYQWDHFHSTVNRDQNGDDTPFSDNEDLSYIFDPATAPEAIRADLQYVWDNTSRPYRDFLNKYKGGFAEPNGGLNPWRSKIDVSVIKDFNFGVGNKVQLRLDVFNVLNLLNYKWGGHDYVANTRLYQITGFDPASNSYEYQVDTNAGQLRHVVDNSELYRIQLGAKYSF